MMGLVDPHDGIRRHQRDSPGEECEKVSCLQAKRQVLTKEPKELALDLGLLNLHDYEKSIPTVLATQSILFITAA